MGRNQNQQKIVQSESQSSQKKQKKRSYTTYLDIAIAIGIFLGLWQLVFDLKFYPSFLLPSPTMAFGRLLTLADDGALAKAIAATLGRLVAGFALSVTLGTVIG